ncbi:MAG: hypothetical protein A3D47_01265 [Candidatus Colwellbacteria bacterium RIFCSPHIGHO2_02_FULL_43_15]|uniref:Tr-type G domain-containing protein n=2 Tax=Candidatus Colwelliibacteriota TaxID=1817904 RepID=A0A1G1YZT3_9BACT|nr:MAG: hypothetical protein A3D47_01265 [Candidatus Colwellbacteria bacterium RIFCSPHIGHO2_02_FULL_43_15]OGY60918.1 MAG: hypothetical protein A3F99_01650 [Candidatus Colwellbacteria bacterium RIFCSPLOWO2_12_FULL_43_11]
MSDSNKKNTLPRPPIVVVVGHVDHGKTSLLDYIRKTNIVSREAGGITQSTGAYEITHDGKRITFIDTPGHEAFSKMRERGAKVADIAILVVAAEESIKPQTTEAIKILRDSQTPFIVAITKIDKPGANVEKVKNDLMTAGVYLEGMGGDVSFQGISSKTGEGVSELLNLILLMGEVLELGFDPKAQATGFVIESLKDMRSGVLAHLVLLDGTLNQGDEIKTASATGKIRGLENFLGEKVKELTPSSPGTVLGFESIPLAGEQFYVGDLPETKPEEKVEQPVVEENKENKVNAVLKADTSGSLEVLSQVLGHLVVVKDMSVGDVTDGDVKRAVSSSSVIVGFGVKVNKAAEGLAKAQNLKLFTSDIIYKLVESIDEYRKVLVGPVFLGELEVLRFFSQDGKEQVVGGKVVMGGIKPGSDFRLVRNEEFLSQGKIINVQEKRKDVIEAKEGVECGLLIELDTKVRAGDKIKVF